MYYIVVLSNICTVMDLCVVLHFYYNLICTYNVYFVVGSTNVVEATAGTANDVHYNFCVLFL